MKNVYTCILIAIFGIGLLMMGCGAPPTYPISATDGEGNSVIVTWDNWVHGTSATTFDIWRSDAPNGTYTEIATGETSPFSDTPDPDTVFFYKVEASDTVMSGFDAGFHGNTTGNTNVDVSALGPDWAQALTNLDTQFKAAYPGAGVGTHVLDCDGGGTETVTISEPDGLTRLDIVFEDCIDLGTGKELDGWEELVLEGISGYLRGLVSYSDTSVLEGRTYINAPFGSGDDAPTFVTDGTWGTDTEYVVVPGSE